MKMEIHFLYLVPRFCGDNVWIPAFAGMTLSISLHTPEAELRGIPLIKYFQVWNLIFEISGLPALRVVDRSAGWHCSALSVT
jgi:hypothetical protein